MSDLVVIERHVLEDLLTRTVSQAVRSQTEPFQRSIREIEKMMWVQKELLTRTEAMRYLDVSADTLRQLEAQGLESHHVGRKKFFKKADLDAFVTGGRAA